MKNSPKAKTNPKRNSMAMGIGLLLLAVVVLLTGYTLGKYLKEDNKKVPAVAKNFYFASDLLGVNTGAIPQYTLQAGVNVISFSLENYIDTLRCSEVDISYTVVLEKDGTKIDEKTGKIVKGRNSAAISFTNLGAGTYIVTATATYPYTQTLKGRFTIVDSDYGLEISVSDASGSPNLKVKVTTTDFSGDLVISWPEGVLPDNTDPLLKDATGQSCVVSVNAQSEYTFQFFKTDPKEDYSYSITVEKHEP